MLFPPGHLHRTITQFIWICLAVSLFVGTAMSQAQSNAADLQGVVRDQNGAVVVNASVSARNLATNISREATTNDAVPPTLAPIRATRVVPSERRNARAAVRSVGAAFTSFCPSEHPPSPPGQ